MVSGAVNTLITFLLYVALLAVLAYPIAYSTAFLAGIAISYALNRYFVFRSGGGIGAMMLFPLVYLLQYALGLVVVVVWVDILAFPEAIASLAAVAVTIPITYALARHIFIGRGPRAEEGVRPVSGAAGHSERR